MSNIEEYIEEIKTFAEYSQEVLNDMEYEKPVDVTITQKEVNAINNLLSERKQDKARIKELEEELYSANKIINEYLDDIPNQREKEMQARIKELENKLHEINEYILINGIDEPLKTATQIKVENQQQYIIQEKINLLKKKLENSIPKQKVKDVLQNNRNEIFSFTYVDDEQFKPYTMQIDRINKIENELLEEGE